MSSPQALEIILLRGRAYDVNWFADPSHDNIAFSASYSFVLSLFFTWLIRRRRSRRWPLYLVGTAIVLLLDALLTSPACWSAREDGIMPTASRRYS